MASNSFDDDDVQNILVIVARENGFKNPKFAVTAATKPGDNYLGRVSRVLVSEDGKEPLSLIFKTAPLSKICRDSFRSGILFSNEGNMYNVILPALNDLLRDHGISDRDTYPCSPRCFYTKLSDDFQENALDVLVLEDMQVRGYSIADRYVGLSAEQLRAILYQLALLHASSLGLRQLRPEEARRIESTLKSFGGEALSHLMRECETMMKGKINLVEDRYPEGTPEHTKLKAYLDNSYEITMEMFGDEDKDSDLVQCINHGDCWTNNVLFKYDESDKIEDICLLDFQAARVTSPLQDLMYLLFTCTTKKTRDAHYETLLREYHQEVTRILKALGCDPESIFSWSKFQKDLKKVGRFALGRSLLTIPFFLAESSEVPQNIDTLMDESGTGKIMDIFGSVNANNRILECKERVSDVLLDCIEYGYI